MQGGPYVLVMPYSNQRMEIYQGATLATDMVKELYGADRMVEYREAHRLLDSIFRSGKTVWADLSNENLMKDLERVAGKDLTGKGNKVFRMAFQSAG